MIGTLLKAIASPILDIVDKLIPDKELAAKLKHELELALVEGKNKEIELAAQIVLAEARGGWLQRNWRPILMISIVAIVINNYLIWPYFGLIWPEVFKVIPLPDKLWNLMMIGIGGYVIGRSGEKIAGDLKGKP